MQSLDGGQWFAVSFTYVKEIAEHSICGYTVGVMGNSAALVSGANNDVHVILNEYLPHWCEKLSLGHIEFIQFQQLRLWSTPVKIICGFQRRYERFAAFSDVSQGGAGGVHVKESKGHVFRFRDGWHLL